MDPILTSGQCPNSCNYNGDCVVGICHCFIGFDGPDCSKRKYLFYMFMHLVKCFVVGSFMYYFLQGHARAIVVGMGNAAKMVFVNVQTDSPELIAQRVSLVFFSCLIS